jgi:hypothetical protein
MLIQRDAGIPGRLPADARGVKKPKACGIMDPGSTYNNL